MEQYNVNAYQLEKEYLELIRRTEKSIRKAYKNFFKPSDSAPSDDASILDLLEIIIGIPKERYDKKSSNLEKQILYDTYNYMNFLHTLPPNVATNLRNENIIKYLNKEYSFDEKGKTIHRQSKLERAKLNVLKNVINEIRWNNSILNGKR